MAEIVLLDDRTYYFASFRTTGIFEAAVQWESARQLDDFKGKYSNFFHRRRGTTTAQGLLMM